MADFTSTTDQSKSEFRQSGYFRLGHVVLDIPPTDISTNKVVNDDQVATLRTGTPMFVKSGQSRWDVTVHWKAVRQLNQDDTYDYSQWAKLRNIVAIFRAAPFVEVENDFLRQHFTNIHQAYSTARMAFALRQLRVDSDPSSTNVINVTMTMSLFNYAPYSKDFGYVGDDNVASDAVNSTTFKKFIDTWQINNMNRHPYLSTNPQMLDWTSQEDGVLTIKWRKYLYIPFKGGEQPPAVVSSSAGYSPTSPSPRIPQRVLTGKLSDEIKQIIATKAAQYHLDPAIVEAQCLYESNGNPSAISRTGAVGLLQLLPSTAQLTRQQLLDPTTNIDSGCKYLALQLQKFGNYPHALGAYNAGPGYIYAYRDGKTVQTKFGGPINPNKIKTVDGLPPAGVPQGENAPKYVQTILTNAGRFRDLAPIVPQSTDGLPPTTPTTAISLDAPDQQYAQKLQDAINGLPSGVWWLDHFTELGAYFFEEEQIVMASAEASVEGDFDCFPSQFSIVFVNNLPLIPLAAMQYPTFQQVGPTDTIISIAMDSVGDYPANTPLQSNESEHPGIQALTAMITQLESQFQQLRTNFRAVSSIHRMQAVFMENKILNLLGIEGTIIRGLNTETVPDSSNLSQVSLLASQYENIFEELGQFRVNGIFAANAKPLKNVLLSGQLSSLSKEEQNALTEVKKFADAWIAKDTTYLVDQIFSISKQADNDFLSSSSGIASAGLRPDQKAALLSNMDLAVNSNSGVLTAVSSTLTAAVTGSFKTQGQVYPGLQNRVNSLKTQGTDMNYGDYLVFTSLPVVTDVSTINNIRKQVETKLATQKSSIVDSLYQNLFDWEILTNPAFSRQAQLITNSPAFKDKFNQNVSANGPATQKDSSGNPINPGHGCYRDYGLTDYNETPAKYFVDYNQEINDQADGVIEQILGTANEVANQANKTASVGQGSNAPTSSSNSSQGFTFTDGNQGLPGGSTALSRMKTIPAYSMNTAFPTFKLLLIEEDNTGPFFCFDNFYSYASVIDIEVIKYREQPDTAIIQISNLANLLQHRMYDDTAAGKMERQADKFNTGPTGGVVQGGPGVVPGEVGTGGGVSTAGITASKTAAGIPYQYWRAKDLVEGRTNHGRIPLKFFALQTGSKIQVRLGFSNNPDLLFPVFTGQVTQIEGNEILTITCQSFQLELLNTPGTTVNTNSRWGLNFLNGGAAYGGYSLTDSGDTLSIMQSFLRSPSARHFGYWKINGIASKKIKGFEWSELAGKGLAGANNKIVSQIGSILQTGYDRSGENILINSSINIDASKTQDATTKNTARAGFDKENPNIIVGTAKYGIDKQSKRSIWELCRDVSRRYPHFNLMVRDYGFPFASDATLVLAHPLDWYYSRPPLYGDAEKEVISNVTHGKQFTEWWTKSGKTKWDEIWAHAFDSNSIAGVPIRQALANAQGPMTDLASQGPDQFSQATDYLHGVLTGAAGINLDAGRSWTTAAYDLFTAAANAGNLTQKFYINLDANFQALYREWLVYLQLIDPKANSSRIKPVRKYHLIDYNHIVHNGMRIDDDIYNAVKISDLAPMKFNQNIPEQHTRVLDVTDMIEDPANNVKGGWTNPISKSYAQSFLREEVGKMYRGEIVLRGVPEIEPYDVLLLNDMSTGIIGPVEVDQVIHSFNLENGYITIVKPRLMVIANESVSCNIIQTLGLAWANASAVTHDLGQVFNPLNINTTTSARLVEGGAAAGGLLLAAAATAWVPPLGLTLAALGLLAGAGLIVVADIADKQNPFKILPVSRYSRPYIGGLQGFEISNFAYSLGQKFKWFDAEEFAPTIESWNELINYRDDYLPQ